MAKTTGTWRNENPFSLHVYEVSNRDSGIGMKMSGYWLSVIQRFSGK